MFTTLLFIRCVAGGQKLYKKDSSKVFQDEIYDIHNADSKNYNSKFAELLPNACHAMRAYMEERMASLVKAFRNYTKTLADAMGGDLGVTAPGDISMNLANAEHFDCNDRTPGISLWTETKWGQAKNWYFLLPSTHTQHKIYIPVVPVTCITKGFNVPHH